MYKMSAVLLEALVDPRGRPGAFFFGRTVAKSWAGADVEVEARAKAEGQLGKDN